MMGMQTVDHSELTEITRPPPNRLCNVQCPINGLQELPRTSQRDQDCGKWTNGICIESDIRSESNGSFVIHRHFRVWHRVKHRKTNGICAVSVGTEWWTVNEHTLDYPIQIHQWYQWCCCCRWRLLIRTENTRNWNCQQSDGSMEWHHEKPKRQPIGCFLSDDMIW